MSAPVIEPAATPRLLPLARFGVVFGWGLRRAFRGRKILVAAVIALGLAVVVGLAASQSKAPPFELWTLLDVAVLGIGGPLLALALVGGGFGEEIQDQTLVFHLIRPVSRTTVFLARYASGLVPAATLAAAATLVTIFLSGVALSPATTAAVAGISALGVATVGAVYYALAALFKRGLVAGLVYTFVVESFFQFMPGAIQKLSLTHHIRSLYHRVADEPLAALSPRIRVAIEETKRFTFTGKGPMKAAAEPWTSTSSALLICAVVAVTVLLYAARAVRRRDFALKD